MSSERQRLRPWLEDMINSEKVPGLRWCNEEKKEFRVAWKHAGKPDFIVEKDAMLFKLWAEHTGKYRAGESADPSTWKTRFRCALHKMPDVEEIKVPHSLDEKEPYRVFRFKDKVERSQNNRNSPSPRSEDSRNGKHLSPHQKHFNSTYEQNTVIHTAPQAARHFFNNDFSSEASIRKQQESPYQENSDSSVEDDIDIDSITPTLPAPYMTEPMLTDDQTYGTPPFGQFLYPHSNGYGFNIGDRNGCMRYLTSGLESMDSSFKKDFLSAVIAANANLPTGSIYGEPIHGHTLVQQMKMLQGITSQDEYSMVSNAGSTHLNLDNGLIEPSCMDLDNIVGRMVTIPYSDDVPASSLSKSLKSVSESWDCAMHIRAFYDHSEVFATETTLTENERVIRIFHGSPVGPGHVKMDVYSKVFGPPGAKQVELPEARDCSKDTNQVLENLKRGLVLEMNEERDIFVLRLCLSKVFYCNGRKAAKKLNREERVKVFDYKGKFLPILKESRNGNCACPSYDVTFYLGRANGSLVSIVVTHVLAKMNLHQINTTGETFLSEPNQNDQLATRLEQDCMY